MRLWSDLVTSAAKRKGDKAETEIARYLCDLSDNHWNVRRALGAGRHDDRGDLVGLPSTIAQVRNWPHDVLGAERTALRDVAMQLVREPDALYGVAMVRHPGGAWVVAMTPAVFVRMLWNATNGKHA